MKEREPGAQQQWLGQVVVHYLSKAPPFSAQWSNSPQFFILNITAGISPVVPLPVPWDSQCQFPPCHPETKQLPRAVATRTFSLPSCPLMPLNPMSVREKVMSDYVGVKQRGSEALVKIIKPV